MSLTSNNSMKYPSLCNNNHCIANIGDDSMMNKNSSIHKLHLSQISLSLKHELGEYRRTGKSEKTS